MGEGVSKLRIRRARPRDATRMAGLTTQLGYPVTAQQMASRLKAVLRAKTGACFVAETPEEGVIGWVHVSVKPLLEVDRRAELDGLVVDEKVRSRGTGAGLLEAAEKWAKAIGAKGMSVRSNVIRERAHQFYLRQGYQHSKTQKSFHKPL
jgi:GNAT superfamily N-acetyltransferase